jgi:hypothetical protein
MKLAAGTSCLCWELAEQHNEQAKQSKVPGREPYGLNSAQRIESSTKQLPRESRLHLEPSHFNL